MDRKNPPITQLCSKPKHIPNSSPRNMEIYAYTLRRNITSDVKKKKGGAKRGPPNTVSRTETLTGLLLSQVGFFASHSLFRGFYTLFWRARGQLVSNWPEDKGEQQNNDDDEHGGDQINPARAYVV